jgi:hypothetical protein
MKKTSLALLSLALSSQLMALPNSSVISLPGGADVKPMQDLLISLAPLQDGVFYAVSCALTNTAPSNVDMRFELTDDYDYAYGLMSLDQTLLYNAQASVPTGGSTLIISELVYKKGSSSPASLRLRNLDDTNAIQVSQCMARPEIANPKTAAVAYSGSFKASNDTDRTVEIRVGNFFPTPYTISPHSSRWVTVSTDNQNISISSIR